LKNEKDKCSGRIAECEPGGAKVASGRGGGEGGRIWGDKPWGRGGTSGPRVGPSPGTKKKKERVSTNNLRRGRVEEGITNHSERKLNRQGSALPKTGQKDTEDALHARRALKTIKGNSGERNLRAHSPGKQIRLSRQNRAQLSGGKSKRLQKAGIRGLSNSQNRGKKVCQPARQEKKKKNR